MTPHERAKNFLRQCAPHMKNREWYQIIEELVKEAEAKEENSNKERAGVAAAEEKS